ncbi:MAG: hypothetical protein M3O94_06175, partial [Actinomycetota bacterium]|nr:hypothetical protein [Actinomycetota bacterium]
PDPSHWPEVHTIYAAGIAGGQATFESAPPTWERFDATRLDQRVLRELEVALREPVEGRRDRLANSHPGSLRVVPLSSGRGCRGRPRHAAPAHAPDPRSSRRDNREVGPGGCPTNDVPCRLTPQA